MKRLTVALALIVAAVACSAETPDGTTYGGSDGSSKASKSARAEAAKRASASTQPHAIPGYTGGPTHSGAPGALPASYNDAGPVGSAAPAYLRASPARRFVLEIDFVTDRAPSASALEHVEAILERELDKPGGISVRIDDEIANERSQWSFEDIEALERRHRDARSGGDTVTMWMLFLSGRLAGEASTLGVAYEATGTVLFPDRIRSSATALVQASAIERAVLTHEVGHLLGLVNLAVESAYDHEDPDHPGHSKYETSVMYWVVEDTSISSLLSGGPPSDFDRFDRADLAAIRRG